MFADTLYWARRGVAPTPARRAAAAVLTAALAITAACGDPTSASDAEPASGGADATATAGDPALPVTVSDETGAEVTVESIERIIPLDGDVAEIVFALGLGDHVVATDISATYPPAADALPEIGYQRALAPETIAAFEPTVLLATDTAGPPGTLAALRDLGYPLVIVPSPATPAGPMTKIRAVAAALGVPERGERLATDVADEIRAAEQPADGSVDRPRVLALYLRGPEIQLVLGTGSNTSWLIEAAGGIDVAAELGIDESEPVGLEAIVDAAPDVLLVSKQGLETIGGVDGLLETPGLLDTPTGERRRVLAYDTQLLLGGGPRTGELLAQLAHDLHDAHQGELQQ